MNGILRSHLALLAAMLAFGCRDGSDSDFAPELLSSEHLRQGGMRRTFAVERGYRWEKIKELTEVFVGREWREGQVDSMATEWMFFAKKSKWRITGWGETPGELTGVDLVGEASVRWRRDHYYWRRQFWTEFREHSCEEAAVSRRYDSIPWKACAARTKVRILK